MDKLYTLLKGIAPEAEETIKWNTPFFVEPRFVFAFSAHKMHMNFMATMTSIDPFRKDVGVYKVTPKGILQIPYNKPIPENLVRTIAEYRLRELRERKDDSFW